MIAKMYAVLLSLILACTVASCSSTDGSDANDVPDNIVDFLTNEIKKNSGNCSVECEDIKIGSKTSEDLSDADKRNGMKAIWCIDIDYSYKSQDTWHDGHARYKVILQDSGEFAYGESKQPFCFGMER